MKNLFTRFRRPISFLLGYTLLFAMFCPVASAISSSRQAAMPSALIEVVAEQTGLPADVDILIAANYLLPVEQQQFQAYQKFSHVVAWRVLLVAFGIYPYPAKIYPEVAPHPTWSGSNPYNDARTTAILCGIANPDDSPNAPVTTEELSRIVSQLRSGQLTPLPDHTNICSYILEIEANAEENPWNAKNYLGRNSMILAYDLIPQNWLDDFNARGFSFHFELPSDYDSEIFGPLLPGYLAGGLTNFEERYIALGYCNGALNTLHEFTHYALWCTGLKTKDLEPYFNSEAGRTFEILGAYASVNSSEYMAEFTGHWLMLPDERDILRELAPQTAALAEQLIQHFQPVHPA